MNNEEQDNDLWANQMNNDEHKNNPQGVGSSGEHPAIPITWKNKDSREPGKNVSLPVNEFADAVIVHLQARQEQIAGISTSRRDLLGRILKNQMERIAARLEKGENFTDLL